jgi:hypothetical protein
MDNKLLALAAVGGAYWYLKGRKERNPQRSTLRRNPTRAELLAEKQALYDRLSELRQGLPYWPGTTKWLSSKQSAIKRAEAKLASVQRKLGFSTGADIDNLGESTRAGRDAHKKRRGFFRTFVRTS